MKIDRIELRGFKRFTDTTIQSIPLTCRLVVLVGPNGCGKSSVIDAVYGWHSRHWAGRGGWDATYHNKQAEGTAGNLDQGVVIRFHDPQPQNEQQRRKAVYARTAYRNDPEFDLSRLSRVEPAVNEHRFSRLIENDQAVSKNYARLASRGFEDVFERLDPAVTVGQFREDLIGEIRDSMNRLFPGLLLNSLGNPLAAGTFKFDKGESRAFLYKNLSGGEKAAFDLLLDMLIKRREYDDTVFFIDEPEAHMGVRLQAELLSELLRLVPANSQLWIATHSIGMIRRARELAAQSPGEVVFLEFDGVDFDAPQRIEPVPVDRAFWKRALQVTLDDIAGLLAPDRVVLCEGGGFAGARRQANFDSDCYNTIFQAEYPSTVFVGAGNAIDVETDRRALGNVISALAPGAAISSLMDRDDRTDQEILELQHLGVRVLSRRSIESYLLDEAVLRQVCVHLNRPEVADDLVQAAAVALRASVERHHPPDDWKSAAGDTFTAAKRLLAPIKLGADHRTFLRTYCARAVPEIPAVYEALRQDVFG